MSIIVTIQHVNHCYDSACPSLLQFSMSNNVTIQPVTHCYNLAFHALLQFSMSNTVTIQHVKHCYNSACQTLLQFSMSIIVTIQHVNHLYNSACQALLHFCKPGCLYLCQPLSAAYHQLRGPEDIWPSSLLFTILYVQSRLADPPHCVSGFFL